MKPYYQDKWGVTIYHGDCREAGLDNISAVVTDPPYGLEFMGKEWDTFRATRVAKSQVVSWLGTGMRHRTYSENKPFYDFMFECFGHFRKQCLSGSPLLSFGGTRTFHRIACAIEDAGWEIRDTICWVYGSGFPKSLNIGKAIDKLQGNEREVVGTKRAGFGNRNGKSDAEGSVFLNSLPEELKHISSTRGTSVWEGYGTALKPAYEPILLCMNPLDGTFAENALKHKVAGLNIDQCRVGTDIVGWGGKGRNGNSATAGASRGGIQGGYNFADGDARPAKGRFPANFIHDGSQMVLELFPETAGNGHWSAKRSQGGHIYGGGKGLPPNTGWGNQRDGQGSAARFFYCAKASKAERDRGCEDMPPRNAGNYVFRNPEDTGRNDTIGGIYTTKRQQPPHGQTPSPHGIPL